MSVRQRLALGFPINWSHSRVHCYQGVSAAGKGPYYVQWDQGGGTYGENWLVAERDANGVLMTNGSYHAVRIAQYGLQQHTEWCANGDPNARKEFLRQATWLRDSQRVRGNVAGLYLFDFAWPKYGVTPGWCSAMAQGEAISVLLRAEHIEPGHGFADGAVRAALPFQYTVEAGGVVWRESGATFLEEIAVAPSAHVLNGCIFALWGIWELHHHTNDPWLRRLIDDVVQTLESLLPRYDTGWWSLYSLLYSARGKQHVATLKYHAFHIAQLEVLARMFDLPVFESTAHRWTAYTQEPRSRLRVLAAAAGSLYDRALRLDRVAHGAHT